VHLLSLLLVVASLYPASVALNTTPSQSNQMTVADGPEWPGPGLAVAVADGPEWPGPGLAVAAADGPEWPGPGVVKTVAHGQDRRIFG